MGPATWSSGFPNTYTGGTTLSSGTIQLAIGGTLSGPGALTMSGSTLLDTNGQSVAIGAVSGTGTINNVAGGGTTTLSLGNGNGSGTFKGAIQNTSGTTSLVKNGTGTQVLGGADNYTGTTTVNAGILQFTKPASLYNGTQASWTSANITAGSLATLAVNVDTVGDFTPAQAGTLLANLTGANSGLAAGSLFGIDTTNGTATVVFPTAIQNSGGGTAAVGFTKFGTGTLQLTNASNSYSGPTTVVNGQLILLGANSNATPPGLVTVTNSTAAPRSSRSSTPAPWAAAATTKSGPHQPELDRWRDLDPGDRRDARPRPQCPRLHRGLLLCGGSRRPDADSRADQPRLFREYGGRGQLFGIQFERLRDANRGPVLDDCRNHPPDLAVRHLYPRQTGAGLAHRGHDAGPGEPDRPEFQRGWDQRAVLVDSRDDHRQAA